MSAYTKADILQWMLGAFEVQSRQGNELNFPCPRCGHEAFYFNIKKVLGYCHRAGCHRTLNLEQTINIVGYSPELAGYVPGMEKEKKVVEVTLPKGAHKIHWDDREVDVLATRGVTWEMIQKFDIHYNSTHIIVPIYEDSKLVQYNSRRVNRAAPSVDKWFSDIDPDALRYKYASGIPITNFILGWSECKLWDEITFVENTFVSMWLRDLGVTTNFGSYLSPRQVDMLVHSRVKRITFLWDEGANSQKAERMLKKVGISARSIYIKGQPDDHTHDEIKELLND